MRMIKTMLLAGCWLLLSAGAAAQMHAYGVAARVNGAEISNETLERNFQEYLRERNINIGAIRHPAKLQVMRSEVLNQLIDRELLWQAARSAGIVVGEQEVDERIADMRTAFKSEAAFASRLASEGFTAEQFRSHWRKLLAVRRNLDAVAAREAPVTDAEIHAFYDGNPEKFLRPESVRARHILVSVQPDATPEARAAARARIGDLLRQLKAGADFAALARAHSEDGAREHGGDLGHFERGRMVPAFEQAAFALPPGEVSGIVQTEFGFHVIRVEEHTGGGTVPEAEARDQIRAFLAGRRARLAETREIDRLRKAARIE